MNQLDAERAYLVHAMISGGESALAHPLPPAAFMGGAYRAMFRGIADLLRARREVTLEAVVARMRARGIEDALSKALEPYDHVEPFELHATPPALCARMLDDALEARRARERVARGA